MGGPPILVETRNHTGRWQVNILLLSAGGGGGNILRSVKALFQRDVEVAQETDPQYAARLTAAVTTRFLDTNEFSLADVLGRKEAGPLIVLAGLQDPGNLGTILRSAEAFRAGGIVLGEGTVHHLNSKVVRASAGSVFRLPIATSKLSEAIQAMRQNKVRMLATSSHKGIALRDANLGLPLAIFIGREGAGVSQDLMRDMDEFIAIPHSSQVESLNAGVAASIVLYEAARQK